LLLKVNIDCYKKRNAYKPDSVSRQSVTSIIYLFCLPLPTYRSTLSE